MATDLLPTIALGGPLAALTPAQQHQLLSVSERVELGAGEVLIHEGDLARDLYVLLTGEVVVVRQNVELTPLGPGTPLGVLGLLTGRPRAASLVARSACTLARLSFGRWEQLNREDPPLALAVTHALMSQVREDLVEMTDQVGRLLKGRSLPRAEAVHITVLGRARTVATGTTLRQVLPAELDGALVVAGLLDRKPVSLNTAVVGACCIEALTLAHWEGRKVFAHSVGLLLLEAAHRVRPGLVVHLGPSLGTQQLVDVQVADLELFARELHGAMEALVAAAVPIRQEHWAVEEARAWFLAHGWTDAARMLETHRQATVAMSSLGAVYALSVGPLLTNTELLGGARLEVHQGRLFLHYGARDPRANGAHPRVTPRGRDMSAEHRAWLSALQVTSVGDFNDACVTGQVAELVRVAEGFHEKAIGQVADHVAARKGAVRIIAIAGPSSSGKTTFIKRLRVQLQINGLRPRGLSVDDYYVDRERTPRDASGDYDFEALEALDLKTFQDHVARLLRGERVKTARYDFKTGKSDRAGGPEMALEAGDVLMLEGIHGLNPALLGAASTKDERFNVFVHPATALAVDRLTRVSASDLRLLRRIVRDRHGRNLKAEDNIMRWPSVLAGEQKHIFPFMGEADTVFDTSLVYEPSVLKVYAERYLLEVPRQHPAWATAWRLRAMLDQFITVYPDHVPPNSLIREFIGGSGFDF